MKSPDSIAITKIILSKVVLYALTFAAVYYAAFFDAYDGKILVGNSVENYQEILLVLIALLSSYAAVKIVDLRVLFIILAGIAAASLFRELNNQLEAIFFKGSWLIPVLIIAIPTLLYGIKNFKTLLSQAYKISDSFAFGVYLTGFVALHVFSRLFGANDIWKLVMKDEFIRDVARTAEETTELLAYSIIFLGTIELYRLGMTFVNKEKLA